MTATNMAEARRLYAALREFFARHAAGAPDFRALRRALSLCQAASEALDDAYCQEKLRLVGEYAAELFSHRNHAKWGRDSASGVEFLRQQVLNALELCASRLYSLEALRASRAAGEKLPWAMRSGIAQT